MTVSISVAQDGWRESYSLFPAIDTQRQLWLWGILEVWKKDDIRAFVCVCK